MNGWPTARSIHCTTISVKPLSAPRLMIRSFITISLAGPEGRFMIMSWLNGWRSCTRIHSPKEILDIIADRLSEIHYIPWALHDQAFFFKQATTVVFDTNRIIETPEHLCDAVKEMSTSSLYYHFWEARRRTPEKIDDFSFWLKGWNDRGKPLIDAFSRIDFYFMSLKELQDKLCTVMEEVGKTWRKK